MGARKGRTAMEKGRRESADRIKPGDKLECASQGDEVTIRVHPGMRSLKGVLTSRKARRMSFAQIREAAAKAARRNEERR
jgi:hypothetical protein